MTSRPARFYIPLVGGSTDDRRRQIADRIMIKSRL